ncbi:hypothetical protein B6N60_00626 [Richelia sinica FACHB-800]|uniref:Uncharacterized protein n=1 Tax=Richelia sinica FACHB-800 TaxID=1357546 RepID=A0A975T4D3_9NOST|nr:hypothetical protein B6N60_00626 [Richelia sinica FACHB-800]
MVLRRLEEASPVPLSLILVPVKVVLLKLPILSVRALAGVALEVIPSINAVMPSFNKYLIADIVGSVFLYSLFITTQRLQQR